MWIVRLALSRPYTFIVLAILLFIMGPLAIMRTPTDIFPNINIPVVSIVWSFNGFSAQDMAQRITSNYERALTSDVENIEHIESQSLNGVSVIKIFFHPGADINRAIAEAGSNAESLLRIVLTTLLAAIWKTPFPRRFSLISPSPFRRRVPLPLARFSASVSLAQ